MFSGTRGQGLTESTFTTERNDAMRDVIVARDRLAGAARSAAALAAYSAQTAAREDAHGNTCENSGGGRGDRYWFREEDAARFGQTTGTT